MKRVAPLLVVVLGGCPAGLRYHSTHNAPGDADLDTPITGERGDPAVYEEPDDPGENQLGIMPAFWFMPGAGRIAHPSDATLEVGGSVTLAFGERDTTASKGALGFPFDSWGVTFGWAFVQTDPDASGPNASVGGPVSIEATRIWYIVSASAGVAFYPTPGDMDVGAQVSLQAAIFALRMRYVQDSGFEIFGGYEIPIPASITWSR
jgi:hypothetical protein